MCIFYNVHEAELEVGDENLDFGLMDVVFDENNMNNRDVDGIANMELVAARRLQQRIVRNYFT